jgi:stage II sporulation protein M
VDIKKFMFKKFEIKKINVIFFIILLMGMIFGALSVKFVSSQTLTKLNFLFATELELRNSGFNISNFFSSLGISSVFALSVIISSLSFFGAVIIFLLILFRGFGIGFALGYICAVYSLKGVALNTFVMLPGIFVSCIGTVILASESLKFSFKFARKIFPNCDSGSLWNSFAELLKKTSLISIVFILSALIDFLFFGIFSKFFQF